MEDQKVDEKADGNVSSYTIIQIPAAQIPPQYANLIRSKFLRTLKFGNFFFRQIDSRTYFENYQRYIMILIQRPNSKIKLAVLTDEPDTVLGWCLIEDKTLHYVWVDNLQRKQGIAKALCEGGFDKVTHMTHTGFNIFKKLNNVIFDPWS